MGSTSIVLSDIVSISPKIYTGAIYATVILVESTCHFYSYLHTFVLSVEVSTVLYSALRFMLMLSLFCSSQCGV